MIELVIFFTFFGLLVIGAAVTDARGVLPSTTELEAQDRARWARIQRDMESMDESAS
jgi:hypothetical protein